MKRAVCVLLLLTVATLTAYAFDVTDAEMDMVGWINDYRVENGREPLKISMKLMETADLKARQLADLGQLTHYPNGQRPTELLDRVGMQYTAFGENIGRGGSAWSQFQAYLRSDDHRANILGRVYTHVGVSVYETGGKVWTVQHFAKSREPGKDYVPTRPDPEPEPEPQPPQPEPTDPTPGPIEEPEPTPTPPAPTEPEEEPEAPVTRERIYTVRRGDTLYRIARRQGVSLNDLVRRNGIRNPNVIYPGQQLRMPEGAPADTGRYYTVRPGDSLWRISRRYGTSVARLRQLNGLRSNIIYPGQRLRVPD